MTFLRSTRLHKSLPLAAIVAAILLWPSEERRTGAYADPATTELSPVERGRYLVAVLGCHDCHTPHHVTERGVEPDMSRMLSGHPESLRMPPPPELGEGPWVWMGAGTNTAFAGPWGITFAPNLTPDKNTGLGIWTEDMFVRAIRLGLHWGQARPIQPPMPWKVYRNLTDEDLKSVWAYLRTIPSVHNRVPDYAPPSETK